MKGREQLKGIYQPVEQLLTNGGLDGDTENACLLALFHLGYHMQTQVRGDIIKSKYFMSRCPMKYALIIMKTLFLRMLLRMLLRIHLRILERGRAWERDSEPER